MRENPRPFEIYKHFKGNYYQIMTLASHSETEEIMVVYQALYSPYKVCVRPLDMFMSEVDHVKYPEVKQIYRFEKQTELPNEKIDITEKKSETEKQSKIEKQNVTEQHVAAEQINLDPLVLEFLDSDTYEQKLNILAALHGRITNDMINTMAIALDVEVDEGDIEKRFTELRDCIQTLKKYECSRLR